jgi:hypothetical protein
MGCAPSQITGGKKQSEVHAALFGVRVPGIALLGFYA